MFRTRHAAGAPAALDVGTRNVEAARGKDKLAIARRRASDVIEAALATARVPVFHRGVLRHACRITRDTRLRFLFCVSPKYSKVSGVPADAAVRNWIHGPHVSRPCTR